MQKTKTRLEFLSELPPHIAPLALANAEKQMEWDKSFFFKGVNIEQAVMTLEWSKTKEGIFFWNYVYGCLEGAEEISKRFIRGETFDYEIMLLDNHLKVGCQTYPLKEVKEFFAAWDGKSDGIFGEFVVETDSLGSQGVYLLGDDPEDLSISIESVLQIREFLNAAESGN
jgi:hypothetical protein